MFVNFFRTQVHIVNVRFTFCFPTAEVIEGVVADAMSVLQDSLENIRVLVHIAANTKKSRPCMYFEKVLKDELSRPGNGSIIKGQIEFFRLRRNSPGETGVQPR